MSAMAAIASPRKPPAPAPRGRVRLRTLVLTRWVAVAGQAAALVIVHFGLGYRLPIWWALAAVAASAIVNLWAVVGRRPPARLGDRAAALYLAYDLVQLGLLLYLTGGLNNPFAILILAPVTISATILSRRSTLGLTLLALVIVAILAFFASESSKGAEVAKPVGRALVAMPVAVAIEEPRVELAVPEPEPEPEIVPDVQPVVARTARVAREQEMVETEAAQDAPHEPVRTEPVSGCELSAEMALVNAARMFRRQGQFDQAVEMLEEHRRECPEGELAMDRNILLARITCERGDVEAGRALGAPYRDGAFGSLIDQSCGEDR